MPRCRLELFRLERRFCGMTYADVVRRVESHNALGLDEFLRHVAPQSNLGSPQQTLARRHALVPPRGCLAAIASA